VETRLIGNARVATVALPQSDSWLDVIVGVHLRAPLSENWFLRGFADVGGFGLGSGSDMSWQVYAGGGYSINDSWSVEVGSRHLSIDKNLDNAGVDLDLAGPLVGITARF
jgi:hypothetical protein